jgi:MFS family permease
MIPIAWMASGIISKLGPKWALFYGTLGYIFYAAALYTNSAFGNQWFVMFGAFLSAMTSGVFFPVEGAIITIYPEPWYKGRALALWQSMYRVGV